MNRSEFQNLDALVRALTPERYALLRRAVELGKWQDGRLLGDEERTASLQILIAYDNLFKPEDERIGYLPKETETDCDKDSANPASLIVKSRASENN